MLFADPEAFRYSFEVSDAQIQKLLEIAGSVLSIEHINDGPTTAPSKRIIGIIKEYEGRKTSAGPDIAEFIGLAAIRKKCAHFNEWLAKLENLNWNES